MTESKRQRIPAGTPDYVPTVVPPGFKSSPTGHLMQDLPMPPPAKPVLQIYNNPPGRPSGRSPPSAKSGVGSQIGSASSIGPSASEVRTAPAVVPAGQVPCQQCGELFPVNRLLDAPERYQCKLCGSYFCSITCFHGLHIARQNCKSGASKDELQAYLMELMAANP